MMTTRDLFSLVMTLAWIGITVAAACWGDSCGPCQSNTTGVCYPYECMDPLLPNGTCPLRSNVCACGLIYRDHSESDGKPACCGDCPSNRTHPGKPVPPVCPPTPAPPSCSPANQCCHSCCKPGECCGTTGMCGGCNPCSQFPSVEQECLAGGGRCTCLSTGNPAQPVNITCR